MQWGRKIFVFGAVMTLLSATPALLVYVFPLLGDGFLGTLAIMLTLTVTPLGIAMASVGAIALLVAALRRGRP